MKRLLLTITTLLIFSCKNKREISKNDLVFKCVITEMKQHQSKSTLEYEPLYTYKTDCGTELISYRGNVYKIGDTITYVYVNRNLK